MFWSPVLTVSITYLILLTLSMRSFTFQSLGYKYRTVVGLFQIQGQLNRLGIAYVLCFKGRISLKYLSPIRYLKDPCLNPFYLLCQKTTDWAAYKQERFISNGSGGWKSNCGVSFIRRSSFS